MLLAAVNPYVQNPAQDAMTITWFTQANTAGTLTVSLPGGAQVFSGSSTPVLAPELAYHANEVPLLPGGIDPGPPYKHNIRVTGLTAGTTYDYTVIQGAETYNSNFRTSPTANSSVRFVVYGDSETEPESTGWKTSWAVPSEIPDGSTGRPVGLNNYVVDQTEGYLQNLSLIESRNPDFIGIAGDIVQAGGEQRDWDEFWRHNSGDLNDIASTTPIFAALGNHENWGGPGGLGGYGDAGVISARDKFKTYFETPDNGSGVSTFEDRYFRYDYGPVTFISLDLTNGLPAGSSQDTNFAIGPGPGPEPLVPDFNPGSTQYQWLEAQLADTQANSRFTFVQFHHVPYSVGPHGFPAGNGGNNAGFDNQSGVPVRILTPLFAQYGVDAVFAGHDEMYERSVVNGIQFYDSGIGGDGLRGPSSGQDGSTNLPSTNPDQQFLAHLDAPEVWNGDQLVSGGKHYGHMEVDVFLDTNGIWTAELEPVYNFPLMDISGNVTGWERRVYDDVVVLTASGVTPTSTAINGSANANRSGVGSLTVNFDNPTTVGAATSLNLFNHTTGQSIDLSAATLVNNGSTSVMWDLSAVTLPDGRYTAELPANATTVRLAQTLTFEYVKLAGDVDGDGFVNFNDFFAVDVDFNTSGSNYKSGDADGDGQVNFNDFFAVDTHFNALVAALSLDFGDVPDSATFPTTLANDGARHVITGNTLRLGTLRDGEADGLSSIDATGDNVNGSDDENGIVIVGDDLIIGTNVGVTVTANVPAAAVLNGWVDFNRDGDWDDPGEQIFVNEPIADGSNSLTVAVPAGAPAGTTFARFRLTETGGYSYFGFAPNGEVEDYQFTLFSPPLALEAATGQDTNPSLSPESSEPTFAARLFGQMFAFSQRFSRPPISILPDSVPVQFSLFTMTGQPVATRFPAVGFTADKDDSSLPAASLATKPAALPLSTGQPSAVGADRGAFLVASLGGSTLK